MVWNLTKPEVKKKLILQDLQVGDHVRVLETTQPVWGQLGIPAGTELKVKSIRPWYAIFIDNQNQFLDFVDTACKREREQMAIQANRILNNLEKIE